LQDLLKKNAEFIFGTDCEKAMCQIKEELTSYPVLRIYNPSAETELHTDACIDGLGAILLQRQSDNNLWAPIAYFSQATNCAEKRYHSFELEMLAMVRAVERFHLYLYGINFTIVTDCNALVYAVTKANLNPRIARWTLALQEYSFKVTHRPGSKMVHVDALSRSVAYVNELPLERELELRQLVDPRIKEISENLEFSENEKFDLVDGLVYRKIDGELKFVVPEAMTSNVLRTHHDNMAHCGYEKTLKGIQRWYWFPNLRKRVADHLENCLTCMMANAAPNRFEGESTLYPLPKTPMDAVHVDHFGPLQEAEKKFKHILVVVDAYTRFTWLRATKSTSSKETITALREIFDAFGKPGEIITDRGTAFTSHEFADFVVGLRCKHRKVAVAAPWANGTVERVNRFLKSSLTKVADSPDAWKKHLGFVQYIINNTYHSVIKASPARLMLGYDQRSHEDYPLAQFTSVLSDIETDLEKERNKIRKVAQDATNLVRDYNKVYRETKSKKPTIYKEGDRVLIRDTRPTPGTSSKLKPNYKGPYEVRKCLGNNRYVVTDIPGYNLSTKPLDTILSSDRLKYWIKPVKIKK